MRKLAIFASAFAVATLFCNYFLDGLLACLLLGALTGLTALGLLLFLRRRVLAVKLALFGLAAGFLWFSLYGWFVYAPVRSYDGYEGRCTIEATSYSTPVDNGGRRFEGKLGGASIRLTYYDGKAPDLAPGDVIEAEIHCSLASSLTDSEHFAARGIFLLGYAVGEIELTGSHASRLQYIPARFSRAVQTRLSALYPQDVLPFMTALLTGDKTLLYADEMLTSALSDTGTSHIVAISGMHVGFLVAMIQLLLGKRKYGLLACVPFLLFFIAMVGATPSVVRAGVMALFLIGAQLLMREYDPATAIAASLLVLLLQNPYSIQNVGLQLSYAAVIGIQLFAARFQRIFLRALRRGAGKQRVLRWLVEFLTTTMAASLAASVLTVPLVAVYFGYVSLLSPLVNLLVLWAVSLCFSLGLLSVLAGFAFQPAGAAVALLPTLLARYICQLVRLAAGIPYAALYTLNRYVVFWLVFCYGVFGLALACRELRQRPGVLGATVSGALVVVLVLTALESPGVLTASALDVGQGQCVLLLSPKQTVVVDCGGDRYEGAGNLAAEYLLSKGRRMVDTLVLTHFHADHANGVRQLMQRMQVRRLVVPLLEDFGELGDAILELAVQKDVEITYIDSYTSWETPQMTISCYPPLGVGDENEQGLSLLCTVGEFALLITGDMSGVTEQVLLKRYTLPDLTLLFAGHHGSKYSTSEALLETLEPEFAILSAGAGNPYGHPAPATLDRLAAAEIFYYRTDECGNISFRLNEVS